MKASNYGELISKVTNKPLIAYVEFGSYSGEYIAVIDGGNDIELWKGYYGSCSGCDWLVAARDWENDEVSDEAARELLREERPFAVIPRETAERVDEETFISFLPANVRSEIYDFDGSRFYMEVRKGLINTPKED